MDASSPSSINIDCSRPEVILMSMKEPRLEVAKGLLVSDDPMTLVDGKPMRDGFSLVSITVAMVGTEPLIRPSGRRKTIRDAAGGHMPWVSSFVAIRNIRRDAIKAYEKLEKEKKVSEDNAKDLPSDLQKVTDEFMKKIDSMYKQKEKHVWPQLEKEFPKHPTFRGLVTHSSS
ncbi:uncharacterized protein LOC143853912 [Tasmannia lanceolata]|uniref:uncharacterized protein LOC143853912 n=1 Tax=Tasmannia lanceolata TaxID=3420 RepID=UPI004063BC23